MQENITETNLPNPTPLPKKRRNVTKVILVTLGCIVGFVLLMAVLIPLLFEKRIKEIFIKELNKSLATEITIKQEDINLSLLKNFPEASVVFNNIGIRESVPNSKKNFLEAQEISLLFNVMNILRGNYNIKNIIVTDGYCHLITDKKGDINYKFWKDSEDTSSEDFSVNLEKVIFSDIDFQYLDFKNNQDISMLLHNCEMMGNFSSDNYILAITGDLLSKRIKVGSSNYLVNKETLLDTKMTVDVKNNTYSFKEGKVVIDKNTFALNGSINLSGEDYYDLSVVGEKINLEGLLLLLPGSVSSNLSALKSKGNINFSSTIKGNYSKTKTPAINLKFDVKNGNIAHEKFGGEIKSINFSGTYSNGEQHNASSSYISVKDFSAKQGSNPVTMKLEYTNFKNPTIDMQLDGNFPASIIIPLVIPNAKDVEGEIALNNINIKGNIKTLSSEAYTSQPTGNITFNNVAFVVNEEKVIIPGGSALVANNEIIFNNLNGSFAGSDLKINMQVNNWIQNVFPSEMKPALNVNGTVSSDKIELNRLMAVFGGDENTETPVEPVIANEQPMGDTKYNFSGFIDLTCKEFIYEKIIFNNITAGLKLAPGLLIVNELKGYAMDGYFNFNATFREIVNGDIFLQTSGTITSIDVAQLFYQFDNFDQTTLTNKNIKGNITANVYDVSITWNKDFVLQEKSIYTLCDMKIENGELIDYKPLESLSAFVNIKDLKHITFSTLENKIEIKDRVINLPAMQIKSSAVDLYMSGKHTFDDGIDYQFKLSLADIMVRKFLGGNKQKDNYEEDAEGGVNIFVSMTGTVNDPVLKYNKREAKQKLKESGIEDQRFIDIFKKDPEEEMFKKNDVVPEKKEAKETETVEPEFIEFEDEEF